VSRPLLKVRNDKRHSPQFPGHFRLPPPAIRASRATDAERRQTEISRTPNEVAKKGLIISQQQTRRLSSRPARTHARAHSRETGTTTQQHTNNNRRIRLLHPISQISQINPIRLITNPKSTIQNPKYIT